MSLDIAVEIVRNKIVIAMLDDGVAESGEAAGVTEASTLDSLEHFVKIWIKLEISIGVSMAEIFDILCEVSEEEDVGFADFASYLNLYHSFRRILEEQNQQRLTFAPSQVPMIKPPFNTNFMLLVPLASVPAVEICSLMSEAGVMISALLTL